MKTTKSSKKAANAAKSRKKTTKAGGEVQDEDGDGGEVQDEEGENGEGVNKSKVAAIYHVREVPRQKVQPRLLLKKVLLKPNVHSWDAIFPNIRPDSGTKISENFPGTKLAIFSAPSLAIYVQIVGQKSLAQIRPDSGTKIPESFLVQNCQFFRAPSLAV